MTAPQPRDDAGATGHDPRPRPAYGEYATPEQQRAAMGMPASGASTPPSQAQPAVPAAGENRAPRLPVDTPFTPVRPTHATTSAARPTRRVDRIITFALLAYGLMTVISSVPQLWYFTDFAQTWMNLAGIDATFSNVAQGDLWGRIGALVFIAGWLLTAVLSWRAVARARIGWWIPLVGAIVTFVVVTVCLTVPLIGDPAIAAYFSR